MLGRGILGSWTDPTTRQSQPGWIGVGDPSVDGSRVRVFSLPKPILGPVLVILWPLFVYWSSDLLTAYVGAPTVVIPDPTVGYPGIEVPLTRHGRWLVPVAPVLAAILSVPVFCSIYGLFTGGTFSHARKTNQITIVFVLFMFAGACIALGGTLFISGFPIFFWLFLGGLAVGLPDVVWLTAGIWVAGGLVLLMGILAREIQVRVATRWKVHPFSNRTPK